ncbi:hypothetical protein CLV78_10192 [Aliiruegeria haliotis]|uniref:Uncharacterized protein n=1 Tax=Aliiruegeria haliotis TaxID=1280846 RepID=A0A2T0RXT4_9RHOB|nr:hypothetical protein [Aliiruegeria haliotis]PRY25999.1 hypothetical protein CLV78_10192 [Aliiruegeria haliotis]
MRLPPTLSPRNLPRTLEAKVPLKAARDVKNRLLYGRRAPKSDECIYVDPRRVRLVYASGRRPDAPRFRRFHSGLVLGTDWDTSVQPWEWGFKQTAILRHFQNGESWRETGVIDYLMEDVRRKGSADGCRSLEEIEERYRKIDRLYEELQRTRHFKNRSELDSYFRREHGGVFIHVTRYGTPLKAGGGVHRLTIASILELERIPAQLGVIHPDAIRDGHLDRLRQQS